MHLHKNLALLAAALCAALTFTTTHAAIVITEVDPTGSSNTSYKQDWFELTNTGTSAVDITNWTMDDNSNSFALSVGLRGITSIAAKQSVVFIENDAPLTTPDSTVISSFETAWFGSNVPANFTIGAYGGSGVGLGSGGDDVHIFDGGGNAIASVTFGAATNGVSFDNSAGLNNVTLTTLSVVGTNGAFASISPYSATVTNEIGSPGTVNPIPEPASLGLLTLGGLALLSRRRRA